MPRNSQGLYTLPPGNPVIPNTLIESTWANPTMDDIALALTGSLPRNGTAPMTGPLTLAGLPTLAAQAASKAYVDQQASSVAGVPVGSVSMFAGATVPTSWLTCNGAAVSRTTYAALFAAIGVVYGAGDGSTTFALPDLRDRFVRGVGTRVLGATQVADIGPHNHLATSPAHSHAHSHVVNINSQSMGSNASHNHTINDPTHTHGIWSGTYSANAGTGAVKDASAGGSAISAASATNISINTSNIDHVHNVTGSTATDATTTAATVTVANNVGTENVPNNLSLQFIIKALV